MAGAATTARHPSRSVVCSASSKAPITPCTRRESLTKFAGLAAALAAVNPAKRALAFEDDPPKMLCDPACIQSLSTAERVTLPSGLQFQDIVVGTGSSPPVGYQVVVNYVAMTPEGRVFDSSLDRGAPYDVRVGAGVVVAGLDEGLRTMRSGGIRRLYIPGNLSFPKGLPSAAGRPRVQPNSPVVFDVQLLYVPGVDDE